jgi:hypothetical protein
MDNLTLLYYINEETEQILLEKANNLNSSLSDNIVNLQIQYINVNLPSNLLNNIGCFSGLDITIEGTMDLGAFEAKRKSSFIKAGYIIAIGIASSSAYTINTITSKRINYNI